MSSITGLTDGLVFHLKTIKRQLSTRVHLRDSNLDNDSFSVGQLFLISRLQFSNVILPSSRIMVEKIDELYLIIESQTYQILIDSLSHSDKTALIFVSKNLIFGFPHILVFHRRNQQNKKTKTTKSGNPYFFRSKTVKFNYKVQKPRISPLFYGSSEKGVSRV